MTPGNHGLLEGWRWSDRSIALGHAAGGDDFFFPGNRNLAIRLACLETLFHFTFGLGNLLNFFERRNLSIPSPSTESIPCGSSPLQIAGCCVRGLHSRSREWAEVSFRTASRCPNLLVEMTLMAFVHGSARNPDGHPWISSARRRWRRVCRSPHGAWMYVGQNLRRGRDEVRDGYFSEDELRDTAGKRSSAISRVSAPDSRRRRTARSGAGRSNSGSVPSVVSAMRLASKSSRRRVVQAGDVVAAATRT